MTDKNIVFPTDFSDTSFNAFTFAVEYAKRSDQEIIVFHTYDRSRDIALTEKEYYTAEEMHALNVAGQEVYTTFEKIAQDLGYDSAKIKYVARPGKFISTFKDYIAQNESSIAKVVMGTENDGNRLFEFFTDSKTIKILTQVNKPLVAIPQQAKFDGEIDNIVYLVDYRDDEVSALEALIEQSKIFDSKIHVLHFDLAHRDSIVEPMANLKETLSHHDLTNVVFESIDSTNLLKSLTEYCQKNEIDIVYLINHGRNFYQRLFYYSVAEDLIKEIHVPIMAIYQN